MNEKYHGVWTALITPFKNAAIDFDAIAEMIEKQVEGGVTGILVIGTTGESPTLTDSEGVELTRRVKEMIAGRCLLMSGCGTNCTAKSVEKTKEMCGAGADVLLAVNPYYNKPTQEGLYRHFMAIAEASDLPVVLYNINGRTGINLETETVVRLANDAENIIGVKEASGNMDQMKDVIAKAPEGFVVLSGDDGLTLELIEAGGHGVVSVASNVIPGRLSKMVADALAGNMQEASAENEKLMDLFNGLFVETNPIPVKYAAHLMGMCEREYRLPMCEPSESACDKVEELCKNYNLV
jgi:4-hydroxy-tetrahydrodipicolinate synthase